MNTRVPTVRDQLTTEFGFEIANTVTFMGFAGTTKIIETKAILIAPFQDMPHEHLVGHIFTV